MLTPRISQQAEYGASPSSAAAAWFRPIGFYEWPVVDGEKQARAFALKDGSPFAFAAIWDRWKDKDAGETLESFAIVTVDPNEWMAKYHDRMGVILKPKDYQRWLEEGQEQGRYGTQSGDARKT
jgi:putative SOS response-associated peptidase YedK